MHSSKVKIMVCLMFGKGLSMGEGSINFKGRILYSKFLIKVMFLKSYTDECFHHNQSPDLI